MSDLDVLRELIKEEALTPLEETSYDKKSVTLREPGYSKNSGYSVQIKGVPEDTVVIKADGFPPPNKIFKCEEGECKRADFVMITNTDQANWILYIEMTSGKKSKKEIIQQLKGAQCFISYCQEIGRTFWQQPDFLEANYQNRFISIKKTGLNKQQTNPHGSQHDLHDRPESVKPIPGQGNLHFNKLVFKNS